MEFAGAFLKTNACSLKTKRTGTGAPGGAPSVKHLTLGFSSGHDLMVRGFKPRVGLCADSVEPAWDSLSPSFCTFPACARSLSLSLSLSLSK